MTTPIPIATDGQVSATALPFRHRGRLQLAVVVKATFSITPDAAAALAAPGEIVREDRTFEGKPSRSVEVASDLAPYRARCDVTFVGHAHAPGGRPVPAASVRFLLVREGRPLLDKVLHVFGERRAGAPEPFTRVPIVYERAAGGPGEPNPVGTETPSVVDPADPRRPAGLAPISCFWPARKRLLGKTDRRVLTAAPIADIPDDIAWDYFQAAPPDQQVEPLRGGEWLVLDGLHPTLPRVQTMVPMARAAARVVVRRPGVAPELLPIEMICDTLAVDGDRQAMALVWRGRHEIAGGAEALSSLGVAAALEKPGEVVDWARLAAAPAEGAPAEGASAGAVATADAVGEGTMAASPEQIAASARRPATPFAGALGPAPAPPPSTSATPWGPRSARAVPVAAGEVTLGPARTDEVGEATHALQPEHHAALAQRAPAPFALAAAGTPPSSARPAVPGAPWSGPSTRAPAPAGVGEETLALSATATPRPPLPAPPPATTGAPDPVATHPETDALLRRLQRAGVGAEEAAILLRAIPVPAPR